MKSNQLKNDLSASVGVVASVCAQQIGVRSIAPKVSFSTQQESAWRQLGTLLGNRMRPMTADLPTTFVAAVAPKHAPRNYAHSGTRTWSPPV